MAFTVNLYNFTKRENSTARPTGQGTPYSCIVRTNTGILKPTIELDLGLATSPYQYNYAYISEFGRYYFIEEWTFSERLWTAQLSVDVLATYKTEIGASSLYILRAAAAYDGSIVDNLYPTKTNCTYARDVLQLPWAATIDRGVFVLGIVAKGSIYGSLDYIGVSYEDMALLVQGLMEDVVTELNQFDFEDASQQLQLNLIDPLQYIKSCIYLPIASIPGTTKTGSLKIYNYTIPVRKYKSLRETPYTERAFTFTIPKHPQTSARGNFVNTAPYTNISISIPPFGEFPIDTTVSCNAQTITANVRIDIPTGRAILSLFIGDYLLRKAETMLGVPVQLSQVSKDYFGAAMAMANGAVGVAGSLLSKTPDIAGAVGSTINAIGSAHLAMIPKSSSSGSGGSYAQFLEAPRLDAQFFECVDDDISQNGRPLCQMRTINTLSGYMIIQDGDVPIAGTASEAREIKRYLETGFYYE